MYMQRGLLALIILVSMQWVFALFYILLGNPQKTVLFLLLTINLMFYGVGWIMYNHSREERRLRQLPVRFSEILIARFAFKFLIFGGIYLLLLPMTALFRPEILKIALMKLIVPGTCITLLVSAKMLFFYDLSVATARIKTLRYLFLGISFLIPAVSWMSFWPFMNLAKSLSSWFMNVPINATLTSSYMIIVFVAFLLLILDMRLIQSERWHHGLNYLSGEEK
jgi:hypothetical protein